MTRRWLWRLSVPIGLAISVLPLPQGLAAQAQPVALSPETTGQPAMMLGTLVGTVMAVVPESRTVVAAVPLEQGLLRLGAVVTDTATITTGGKPTGFDTLTPGAMVRIEFRRVPDGDEATAIEVLREARG